MILQALTSYYEEQHRKGKISDVGWDDSFKVSFLLEIDDSGSLIDVIDNRELTTAGKKQVLLPQAMCVPAHKLRSSGVAANFLCDNSSYMLGADEKGKPERAKECFKACAALHHELLDGLDSPSAKAVLAFFDTWKPELASSHPLLQSRWRDVTGNANFLFCHDDGSGRHPVTRDAQIQAAWERHYAVGDANAPVMQCLITGQTGRTTLTHPAIKGVRGAQSSGGSLVSFNAPAFCSYGHEQGENAPVGEYAAFAYTTALNALLADRKHCKILGDTTVVCWAENAGAAYADLGIMALFGVPEDSGVQEEDVSRALALLAKGQACEFLEQTLLPEQHVYFLGLAPNAARLSVRFFLRDSLSLFAAHIRAHEAALAIVRPSFDTRTSLSVWDLARETARRGSDGKYSDPAPQLAGDLLRAVLTGGRYPATLLNGVTLRIRAEHTITRGKAAILKAYYTRNTSPLVPKEVLTVELNEQSCYQPYVLGRLFAVLETVQDAANPGINATIKDKYFNSACATPSVVFPTLIKLAQKHLQKLGQGSRVFYSRQLTELMGKMTQPYPVRMTLPEQGAFEIGYYHQTQKRYEKKDREDEEHA